jgi:glycine cleavage system transcriptional repressor
MNASDRQHFVVSVLVADRVGILRDITSAVTDMGANIDGISQTVVRGYFTVILTASMDRPHTPQSVREAIAGNFAPGEASIVVRPYDPAADASYPTQGDRYVLTMTGKDRKGILKATTAFLAARNINIEDWYVIFEGDGVTHIGEITVPDRLDIKHVQAELAQTARELGLQSFIQHENIFRVTNEVGAVRELLRDGRHA